MRKILFYILAVLIATGALVVAPAVDVNPFDHAHDGTDGPVATAEAHYMNGSCHHGMRQNTWWEENYLYSYSYRVAPKPGESSATYHVHIYRHVRVFTPWVAHRVTKTCGRYTSWGLTHY